MDFFQHSFVFKKKYIVYFLLLLVNILLTIYAQTAQAECISSHRVTEARCHWLYRYVPRHRCQIPWWDLPSWALWALVGNDDDGLFGEEPTASFLPEQEPSFGKALQWAWRNPLHNFCFYVIGSADRRNDEWTLVRLTPDYKEVGVYRPRSTTVFPSSESCFYFAFHGGKPFVSWRIVWNRCYESRFYWGWRCKGNFGFRWNPWSQRKSYKKQLINNKMQHKKCCRFPCK